MASSAARWRTSTPSQLSGSLINIKTTPSCADGPRTSVSLRGPEHVERGRLAEDRARTAPTAAPDRGAGRAGAPAAGRRPCAPPGARGASRCRRGARARRRGAGARSRGARRSGRGRGTSRGSRLAAATETLTSSPRRIAAPPSSTSAVAYRSTIAAAGSSRSDSSIALGSRPGSAVTSASWSRSESRCRIALAIIPSVVSMPPKSITAALETTSRALEAAGSPPAAASSDEPGSRSSTGSMAARSSANAARPAAGTSPPAVTSVTAATIASYQPRTAPVSASRSPSEWVTIAAASGPAKARRSSASPVGLDGVDQPVDLGGDDLGEALADRLQAKRRARTARGGAGARRRRA